MTGPAERLKADWERDQAVLDLHAQSPCDNTYGLCDTADAILAKRAEQRAWDDAACARSVAREAESKRLATP